MQTLSLIGILLGLVVFIFLIYKNYSVIVVAPIASAVVIILSGQNVLAMLKTPFMPKLSGIITSYFLIFVLSSLLGKFASDSGLARSVALTFANVARKSNKNKKFLGIMSIVVLDAILTISGISLFVIVFTVVVIARDLYRDLEIPWHFYGCGVLGSATFTLSMIPGSPQIQNIIPVKYLGTTPMAAPVLGCISAVIMLLLGMLYIKYAIEKSIKNGETFLPTGALISEAQLGNVEGKILPMWKCAIPLLTPFIVMNGFKQAPETSLLVALVVTYILFRKEFTNIKKTINEGFAAAISPLMALAAATAFGGVVSAVPGFKLMSTSLFSLPVPDTVKMLITVMVPTAITGSSSSGMTIALDTFAAKYLQIGLDPAVVHRLATMAGNMSLLPHSAGVINTFVITKLTHKQAYKHYGIIGMGCVGITLIIATILAYLGVK